MKRTIEDISFGLGESVAIDEQEDCFRQGSGALPGLRARSPLRDGAVGKFDRW